jgi:hypothetical protein
MPVPSLLPTKEKAHRIVALFRDALVRVLMREGLLEPEATARLQAELDYYHTLRFEHHTIPDLFQRVITSLANRQHLWNVVFGGWNGFEETIEAYRLLLFGFQPRSVVNCYAQDLDSLVRDLVGARKLPPAKAQRQRNNPRASLRTFGRGVLQAAHHFAAYDSTDEFVAQVRERIRAGRDAVANLPYEFRFTGFSYALAADFLKEVGVIQLGKPDVHVRRTLAELGWCRGSAAPEEVRRCLWDLWGLLGEGHEPSIIDKLVFLAGSGRFEMVMPAYRCRPCASEVMAACAAEFGPATLE